VLQTLAAIDASSPLVIVVLVLLAIALLIFIIRR
jgi:hypothetical protein